MHGLFGWSTQKPYQTFCGSFDENPDQECMKSGSKNKGTACDEFFSFAGYFLFVDYAAYQLYETRPWAYDSPPRTQTRQRNTKVTLHPLYILKYLSQVYQTAPLPHLDASYLLESLSSSVQALTNAITRLEEGQWQLTNAMKQQFANIQHSLDAKLHQMGEEQHVLHLDVDELYMKHERLEEETAN